MDLDRVAGEEGVDHQEEEEVAEVAVVQEVVVAEEVDAEVDAEMDEVEEEGVAVVEDAAVAVGE